MRGDEGKLSFTIIGDAEIGAIEATLSRVRSS
jgi:hypothetical protein